MPSSNRFDGLTIDPAPFPTDDVPANAPYDPGYGPDPEGGHIFGNAPAPAPAPAVKAIPQDPSLTRMEAARRAVESMGIEWPKTIVPEGSSLIDIGVSKLKRDRAAWDRMPSMRDIMPVVREALAAENRKDFPMLVSSLRMRPSDGRVVQADKLAQSPADNPGLAYTPHSMRQLLTQANILKDAPGGFAAALAYINNEERAKIFNRLVMNADPKRSIVLRTKRPHEGKAPILRAVLTKRYANLPDIMIADLLTRLSLPEGARLSYLPGDDSRFEIIFPNKLEIPQVKAGDVHKAGVYINANDVGSGGVDAFGGVTRILCVNLTLGDAFSEFESVRHIGSVARLLAKVERNIHKAVESIAPLLEVIGYSATVALKPETKIADVFGRIAAQWGEGKGAADSWTAWFQKSAYPATAWGVTSAITEAAHDRSNWRTAEEWERIGSAVSVVAVEAHKAGQGFEDAVMYGRLAKAAEKARIARGN